MTAGNGVNVQTPHMETCEGQVGEKVAHGPGTYGVDKSGNDAAMNITKFPSTFANMNADASGNQGMRDVSGPAHT